MSANEKTLLVRPEHLNHAGTLFGGYMMQWADEMAYIAASVAYPKATFVTKLFETFNFINPVKLGDIVRISSSLRSTGNTSCVVDVWGDNLTTGQKVFSTSAVMVNFDGKEKRPLV